MDPKDVPGYLQLELIELQCDAECHNHYQQLPPINRQLDKDRKMTSDLAIWEDNGEEGPHQHQRRLEEEDEVIQEEGLD
ncbi:hypothetical protein D4764_15G0008950 [Takifugu flavidus]|uniref:Uncharacterized protein n=1 Tax=Takifugu flavidus TaxID=433684 RepID=A0A5C6P405_9TELE|nr:hypothetical protein D4764_15G0008950 [Takifugu flavidus]